MQPSMFPEPGPAILHRPWLCFSAGQPCRDAAVQITQQYETAACVQIEYDCVKCGACGVSSERKS